MDRTVKIMIKVDVIGKNICSMSADEKHKLFKNHIMYVSDFFLF